MSEENVEAVRGVRIPVTVSNKNRGRAFDERILLRFPGLFRLMASAWSRLPPSSRLRRTITGHVVRQWTEAGNRRDFEFLFLGLDPEIEFEMADNPDFGFTAPDVVGVHRGHDGYRRMLERVTETLEDLRFEPEEIIDFGDRLLIAGRLIGHSRYTGIALDGQLFQLVTLRGGLAVRQQDFVDRDKALEAAGLVE
jgi:ketosteroid isomerase-like protein